MTKDEMKDKTKRVARFSRNYTKKFREVADILNGILDAVPESGVMPEPKYDLNGVAPNIEEEGFAAFLGISVDKLPDFFKESVIRFGDYILTRVFYSDDPQNDAYRAVWGGVAGGFGATIEIDLSEHNVTTDVTEV